MGMMHLKILCNIYDAFYSQCSHQQSQPVLHTINTPPGLKLTTSVTTLHRPEDFKSQDFNICPFLTHIYMTYIMLTKIVIFNCYGVMVTQLTTLVCLYSCNNNITLKMGRILAETCC